MESEEFKLFLNCKWETREFPRKAQSWYSTSKCQFKRFFQMESVLLEVSVSFGLYVDFVL